MLFKTSFHQGLRSGAISMTVRAWQGPRVRPGARYRIPGAGSVRVDSVETLSLGELRKSDAEASGFTSLDEMVAALRKDCGRPLTARSRLYRVRFRFVRDEAPSPERRPSARAVAEVGERLARLDRASRRGPWTARVLELIAANPGAPAARLSRLVGRDKLAFKADVRKLKGLGLTRSLTVGYELSRLGRALVRKRPSARRS